MNWNEAPINYNETFNDINNNYCRNPNETLAAPWCYSDVGNKLNWDYCNITQCSIPTNYGLAYNISSRQYS